ncbi:hypothetical protein Zmor_026523 [Zophobas morio]|uniref:Uncharacterized protein n=1 Tax=Zophobas morio TaxID=2755281 RepID=A0AA38M605_9CUCU|nr:hypothetical protein Zmor_026523 [Zophobas morio]
MASLCFKAAIQQDQRRLRVSRSKRRLIPTLPPRMIMFLALAWQSVLKNHRHTHAHQHETCFAKIDMLVELYHQGRINEFDAPRQTNCRLSLIALSINQKQWMLNASGLNIGADFFFLSVLGSFSWRS